MGYMSFSISLFLTRLAENCAVRIYNNNSQVGKTLCDKSPDECIGTVWEGICANRYSHASIQVLIHRGQRWAHERAKFSPWNVTLEWILRPIWDCRMTLEEYYMWCTSRMKSRGVPALTVGTSREPYNLQGAMNVF